MTTDPIRIIVPLDAHGLRLDKFMSQWASSVDAPECIRGTSRAQLQRWISDSAVLQINGSPARASTKLKGREIVTVQVPAPQSMLLQPLAMSLSILFEDAHVIVLNKPAGIVVHPGAGHAEGTLVHGLLAHCHDLSGIGGVLRPGIVHRLDRDTSGVLVVAKNDHAHLALAKQFASRTVQKQYLAWVLGTPRASRATRDTFYGRHPIHRKQFTGRLTSGKRAITSYELVASNQGLSLLRVDLGTGRTHQIRVHLAEMSHPIVGDKLYGGRRVPRIASPALKAAITQLHRHALHAHSIQFIHPVTMAPIICQAPVPDELKQLSESADFPATV